MVYNTRIICQKNSFFPKAHPSMGSTMFHVSAALALSTEELYVCPLQVILSSQNSLIYVVWCCKKAERKHRHSL